MSSFILDLQNEVSSPKCDIVSVLRRAHLIASKLHLDEFDKWIMYELNGYPEQKLIPDYRVIRGVVKAFNPYHGWIPVMISDSEIENMFSERKLPNSISELIDLCQKSEHCLVMNYSGEIQKALNDLCDSPVELQNALHITTSSVLAIIEKVKNAVLEWTIRLEAEGVVGENMRFSNDEKSRAQNIPQTINNYYGNTNVINAPTDKMQIVSGNNNQITFSYENLQNVVEELEKNIGESGELNQEDKETAKEILSDIRDKISQKKKQNIIKSAFVGLKDFLIQAGAALAAGLVQAKTQGLF